MNEDKMHKKSNPVGGLRIVPVVEVMVATGDDTQSNRKRVIIQYWDLYGNLLAVNDPINNN